MSYACFHQMTTSFAHSPALLNVLHGSSKPKLSFPKISFSSVKKGQFHLKSKHFATFLEFANRGHPKNSKFPNLLVTRASTDDFIEAIEKEGFVGNEEKPVKSLLWALFWASVSICLFAVSGDAKAAAAADSIKASGFGVKVASALRSLGWPDEIVVFALATLPVLELRGAIPVGYWLQLKPLPLTVLSVLGLVSHLPNSFSNLNAPRIFH